MPVPPPSLPLFSPRNFVFLLHISIDEENIGAARAPSSEMKTGIKLLQDKVEIEHCQTPRVLFLLWKWIMLSPFSSLFPITFLIESNHERCTLCQTQSCLAEHAKCDLNTDSTGIASLWGHRPKGTQFGDKEKKSVSTKQPLSCQAVKELKQRCLQCA